MSNQQTERSQELGSNPKTQFPTHGPWEVSEVDDGDLGLEIVAPTRAFMTVAMPCTGATVGEMGSYHIDDDEARANAHLIAAAPEMYEALKHILTRIEAEVLAGSCSPLPDSYRTLIKTALNKAEGVRQ